MGKISKGMAGRTFQEEKNGPDKGVMAKNTSLFQEWYVIQCNWNDKMGVEVEGRL